MRRLDASVLPFHVVYPQSWDDYFPEKQGDNPFPPTFDPPHRPISLPVGGPWQYRETDWAALDVTDQQYGGDWLVTKWIGEQLRRKRDKPFFLACGIYKPHEPWSVPKKYFDPFPLATIQVGPGYKADDLDDVPPEGQRIARNRYFPHILKYGQWKNGVQAYLATIHFADAMVGRVMDALEKSPDRNKTIVVLWSDVTPCSLSTSWMLASVKMSANGSPSLRAKRARTASRLDMEPPAG